MNTRMADAQSLHQEALAQIEQGALDRALLLLEEVIRIAPDSLGAHASLVQVLQRMERLVEAKFYCQKMVVMDPDDASLVLWLGWLNFQLKYFDEAMICAACVENVDPKQFADAMRLVIFVCGKSGDWLRASIAFERLAARHPEMVDEIATSAVGAFVDHLLGQYRNSAFANVIALSRQMPSQLANADLPGLDQVLFALVDCYLRTGRYQNGVCALEARSLAIKPSRNPCRSSTKVPRVRLITSLMPNRIITQKRAVESWIRLGAEVLSLNSAHEQMEIEGKFPGVKFLTAPRHAGCRYGKPYVYLHDMMTVLTDTSNIAVGLINSDIILSCEADKIFEKALVESRTGLVCGHRYNLDGIHQSGASEESARLYEFGYDWFLFAPQLAAKFMDAPFVFGGPWWDVWFASRALWRRIDLSIVKDPIAFHEDHDQRWSEMMYRELGYNFLNEISSCTLDKYNGRFNMVISSLCSSFKNLIQCDQPSIEELNWFATFVRSLIAQEGRIMQ